MKRTTARARSVGRGRAAWVWPVWLVAVLLAAGACSSGAAPDRPGPGDAVDAVDAGAAADAAADAEAGAAADAASPTEGEIRLLTYNVAGLPAELSRSHPVENMPLIGQRLDAFDLVLVQEDFWYHDDLDRAASHPYRSTPMWEEPDAQHMGDGLNRFSRSPFGELTRVAWEACNGLFDQRRDCLTTKGFSFARHDLAPGVVVDVYDLHMDAGGSDADLEARTQQVEQLAQALQAHSLDVALVVAGDTNLKETRPADLELLARLLEQTRLEDACRFLSCGDERIDRVLFRASDALELRPLDWSVPTDFVDPAGAPLSDHEPVVVTLSWRVTSPPRAR